MKLELNKIENKWINALIKDTDDNNLLEKILFTHTDVCFTMSDLEYELTVCFDDKNIVKFIDESFFIFALDNQFYLLKYENKYYVACSKDGGYIVGCGNEIQNTINTIINSIKYINLFSDKTNSDEKEDIDFFLEEYQRIFNSKFYNDLEKYKRLCESVGLKYSDKQQDYQSEIDEFDKLMRKLGIYE